MSDSFVARRPCGCICAACVDKPEYARDTAKEVARWIRAGLAVTKLPTDEVRTAPWGCEACARRPQAKQGALELEK